MNNNITSVLTGLIQQLNVSVTKTSVKEAVSQHPNYPSILTISDLFDGWKMPNGAFEISSDDTLDIPRPYIVHLKSNNGEFALLTDIDQNNVTLTNEHWKSNKMSLANFKNIFTGRILLAEATDDSGEPDYNKKLNKERFDLVRLPAFIFAIILIVSFNFFFSQQIQASIMLLLVAKTIGVITSMLLLVQHIDSKNQWVKQICNVGKKIDCDSILSSSHSKFFGLVSWAELGAFYFVSTLVFAVINADNPGIFSILTFLNLIALPYTFYSIYYQQFIIQRWCIMCCMIQLVFWTEFLLTINESFFLADVQSKTLLEALLYFFLTITTWLFLKPYFTKAQEYPSIKAQLFQAKYNSDYFWTLLERQEKMNLLSFDNTLTIGDLKAEYTITMVANINCEPCSKAHELLNEWRKENDNFNIQFVFDTASNIEDPREKVIAHLMALNRCNNEKSHQALKAWYNSPEKNYENWSISYPSEVLENDFASVKVQRDWCNDAKIEFTPTIFLNGRKVPESFKIDELRHFI